MKKINLDQIPWRERKSPKGHYHRFMRDVAVAFRDPKTGPKLPGQPPFEVELVRLPPGAKNFPFHDHARGVGVLPDCFRDRKDPGRQAHPQPPRETVF